MGRDPDGRHNRHLSDLIWAGRVRSGKIVSHRLSLADAVGAYKKFDARTDGYIKVVRCPGRGDDAAQQETAMATTKTTVALWVKLEAKPGKESAVADFLKSAVPLVAAEPATTAWFAVKLGPTTFAIFDAFPDAAGRQAHLSGAVAAALMKHAPDLLATTPSIEHVDVLADKLPG